MTNFYALRDKATGEYASFSVRSNDGSEFCTSVSFELEKGECYGGGGVWVTTDKEAAVFAADNDTPWYNADFKTPENSNAGKWEVVEFKPSS